MGGRISYKLCNRCNQRNASCRNYIPCEAFLYSHYREKVKNFESCQCSKPRMSASYTPGPTAGTQLWLFKFYSLSFMETPRGISYWTTCNLGFASVRTGSSNYSCVNSLSVCFHLNKLSELFTALQQSAKITVPFLIQYKTMAKIPHSHLKTTILPKLNSPLNNL